MESWSQRCGDCVHYRDVDGGVCLVMVRHVSADEHHVNVRSVITGDDFGCEDFMTPEADEEWCMALERAEQHSVPWR